jgi:2-amino-4-hydroxy-6-hydroxymethyldihydropteridine diphosphokinase
MIGAETIVLGLGGNVGGDAQVLDRFAQVARGARAWGSVRASSVYRTAPLGGPTQLDFLNAALAIEAIAAIEPRALIDAVLELERACGRDRASEVRWGPRAIDIDVLLWGARIIDRHGPPSLRVPHERLATRAFAVAPVIELVGEDTIVPGDRRTLAKIGQGLDWQRIERTALTIVL